MTGGRERRVATVHHWTGLEAKALRFVLRLSVRAFAQDLGLAVATVSKWESKLADTEPRPDTALGRADAAVHLRFETLLSEMTSAASIARRRVTTSGPRASRAVGPALVHLDAQVVGATHPGGATG